MHYAIYNVDNILLMGGPFFLSLSIFQIQQVESNTELQDIMNSDEDLISWKRLDTLVPQQVLQIQTKSRYWGKASCF